MAYDYRSPREQKICRALLEIPTEALDEVLLNAVSFYETIMRTRVARSTEEHFEEVTAKLASLKAKVEAGKPTPLPPVESELYALRVNKWAVRTLALHGITKLEQLLEMSVSDLANLAGVGRTTINDLGWKLQQRRLHLKKENSDV